MRVWIVGPYGSIPGEPWREYRLALAGRALAAAGHEVVWWVANFEHRQKQFRTNGTWEDRVVVPRFTTRIVPTTAYASHVSLARIRFERNFARAVRRRGVTEARPDVIVLAVPALFTSADILGLVDHFKTKLVLDIVDLWPELFHILLPGPLATLGRAVFSPLYRRRARLFSRADAFIAASEDYLAIAQATSRKEHAGVVYLGVDVDAIREGMKRAGPLPEALPDRAPRREEVWVVYAGTLGQNYDIPTVLDAATLLNERKAPVRILVVGDGPLGELVESTIRERSLDHVHYLPGVPSEMLTRLYGLSDVALSTYVANSTVAMPTKAFDYLAAGLPIINSIGRDLGALIQRDELGLQYESGNATSLAGAIERLAQDQPLRKRMAANAAALAPSFDVRVQYARFVEIVEQTAAAVA